MVPLRVFLWYSLETHQESTERIFEKWNPRFDNTSHKHHTAARQLLAAALPLLWEPMMTRSYPVRGGYGLGRKIYEKPLTAARQLLAAALPLLGEPMTRCSTVRGARFRGDEEPLTASRSSPVRGAYDELSRRAAIMQSGGIFYNHFS